MLAVDPGTAELKKQSSLTIPEEIAQGCYDFINGDKLAIPFLMQ